MSINYEFKERTEGYRKALKEAGIVEEHILDIDVTFEAAKKAIKKNARILKNIDAVFAQTDLMALGTIEALEELSYNVPEDIPVIGFDNIQIGTYFKPRLTTIEQPLDKLARMGINNIIKIMQSNVKVRKFIEPKLIIRQSA